jgi:hypothetical protein
VTANVTSSTVAAVAGAAVAGAAVAGAAVVVSVFVMGASAVSVAFSPDLLQPIAKMRTAKQTSNNLDMRILIHLLIFF